VERNPVAVRPEFRPYVAANVGFESMWPDLTMDLPELTTPVAL